MAIIECLAILVGAFIFVGGAFLVACMLLGVLRYHSSR